MTQMMRYLRNAMAVFDNAIKDKRIGFMTAEQWALIIKGPPKVQKLDWWTCQNCKQPKPPRAHHCSVCNRCILKMDHHCPWIGTCVGYRNHKLFYLFLVYCFLGLTYVVFTLSLFSNRISSGGTRNTITDESAGEVHKIIPWKI